MSEDLEYHSVLAPFHTNAEDMASINNTAGVSVREKRGVALVQIYRSKPDQAFFDAAEKACRGALPRKPNTVTSLPNGTIFWIGPENWLVAVDGTSGPALDALLRKNLAVGSIVDIGGGRTIICIEGRRAREILSKGCPLDLHPRSLKPGACAQSVLARVPILLHFVSSEPVFDLYTPRSYGAGLWQWLADAAHEPNGLFYRP